MRPKPNHTKLRVSTPFQVLGIEQVVDIDAEAGIHAHQLEARSGSEVDEAVRGQFHCAEVVLAQECRVRDAVVGVEVVDVARAQVHRDYGVDLVIQAEVGHGLSRVTHLGALSVEGELLTSNGVVLVVEYSRLEVGGVSPVTQREHTDDLQAVHGVVVHFQFEAVVLNVDAAELSRAIYGDGIVYNDAHPLRDEAVTPVG